MTKSHEEKKVFHTMKVNNEKVMEVFKNVATNLNTCQDDFKTVLDIYLGSVPHQPRIGSLNPQATDHLTDWQSNSLLAWIHEN